MLPTSHHQSVHGSGILNPSLQATVSHVLVSSFLQHIFKRDVGIPNLTAPRGAFSDCLMEYTGG